MTILINKRHPRIALIAVILVLSSCALLQKETDSPEFSYNDKNAVRLSMQQLAISMGRIDSLIEKANSTSHIEIRNSIISELRTIEKISNDLGAGTHKTNHDFIDQHIDQFNADVVQARSSIEAEPSSYYLTGKLVGSCVSCHIQRPERQILININ